MSATIKLTYFNVRGYAESSRLILAQAGVKYEDVRIQGEDWAKLKPNTPTGQLPVLTYNGTEIAQSKTIARFLAGEFNLKGKNALEAAKADMVVDCVTDLWAVYSIIFHEKDEARKAELQKKTETETFPNCMTTLEKLLKENGGKYFAGQDLTWADIFVADFLQNIVDRPESAQALDNFQALKNHMDHVLNLPNIKKWIETRPKTPM